MTASEEIKLNVCSRCRRTLLPGETCSCTYPQQPDYIVDYNEIPTLLDRFAMAALTGILASNAEECLGIEHLARSCYVTAAAMMKVRMEPKK